MADHTFGKPYIDERDGTTKLRTFDVLAEDSEYVWHRDYDTRLIEILEGDGWQFQCENTLPWLLKPGMKFEIKAYEYHRLIKGVNDLKIRITPLDK